MFNPILSIAAGAGFMQGLLAGRAQSVATGGTGTAPSSASADYAAFGTMAAAVAGVVDTLLGQGFDVSLASNANPGVTVALDGAAAGAASLSLTSKAAAMAGFAREVAASCYPYTTIAGVSIPTNLKLYGALAGAIVAMYQQWLTAVYTPNAS